MSKNLMLCDNAFALRPTFFDVTLYIVSRVISTVHVVVLTNLGSVEYLLRTPHDHLSASESAFCVGAYRDEV